jgi:hypothetical protein
MQKRIWRSSISRRQFCYARNCFRVITVNCKNRWNDLFALSCTASLPSLIGLASAVVEVSVFQNAFKAPDFQICKKYLITLFYLLRQRHEFNKLMVLQHYYTICWHYFKAQCIKYTIVSATRISASIQIFMKPRWNLDIHLCRTWFLFSNGQYQKSK